MKKLEQQHPFYKPLWRRIAIVVVILSWIAMELYFGERGIWLWLAVAFLAYAIFAFFINFPKDDGKPAG